MCEQATGKSVDAVERLIMGPCASPIELVLTQGVGGVTRTLRLARRLAAVTQTPVETKSVTWASPQAATRGEGARVRQQIVPSPGSPTAAWSAKLGGRPAGSTQVGLTVAHQQLGASDDDSIYGSLGCGLRVTNVLQDFSIGRYEKVQIGISAFVL